MVIATNVRIRPTAIATKPSEARGISTVVRGYCRPNEKTRASVGVCLFFTSGLQVSSLSPKMMALSKTVEPRAFFNRTAGPVGRSPGEKTLPGTRSVSAASSATSFRQPRKHGGRGASLLPTATFPFHPTPVLFHQPIHRTLSHTTNPNLNRARSILQHARRCRSRCTLAFHLPS